MYNMRNPKLPLENKAHDGSWRDSGDTSIKMSVDMMFAVTLQVGVPHSRVTFQNVVGSRSRLTTDVRDLVRIELVDSEACSRMTVVDGKLLYVFMYIACACDWIHPRARGVVHFAGIDRR